MPGENRISYVVNGGPGLYLELQGANSLWRARNFGHPDRDKKDEKMYTLFFDHLMPSGLWRDGQTGTRSTTKVSIEDVLRMDGTSATILLSENENAGHWIWHAGNPDVPLAAYYESNAGNSTFAMTDVVPEITTWTLIDMAAKISFNFPSYDGNGDAAANMLLSSIATGETVTYEPLVFPTDNHVSALFINEGRDNSGVSITWPYRTARPSSGHPGVVVAAFCDGAVRTLKEDMDKTLFVRLCRPGSGVILNPKDLDF